MKEQELLLAIKDISHEDQKCIIHAIDFVKIHHEGQIRKSGEPYTIHLFAVGLALWNKFHDVTLTIGGLLHDTVEDCENVTIETIYQDFGPEVGFLVDAATKDSYTFYAYPEVTFDDKIERQIWAGFKDLRALLVKIADREHNISTLEHLRAEKQIRMAFETQAIYEPLKNMLSYQISTSLDETSASFQMYLQKEQISTPAACKVFLFQQSFSTFGNDLYGLVYEYTDNVIWEVEDLNLYSQIIQNEAFAASISVQELWSDGQAFRASFYFNKGMLISNMNVQLKISSFKK